MAIVRAIMHRQGLVKDSYAEPMLTPGNRAVVVALTRGPLRRLLRSPFFAALAGRIAFFDRQVATAIESGVRQIVIVGAGYDSRAWRFAQPGVMFYEVDHPATQADKQRRAPRDGPVYVQCDLAHGSVLDALERSGFDRTSWAVFVIEGVTMYLTEPQVSNLLATLGAAATGSWLAVNFAAPPGAGRPRDRLRQSALRLLGAAHGEAHRFFVQADHIAEYVAGTGWSVTEAVTLRDEVLRSFPDKLNASALSDDAGAVAARREISEVAPRPSSGAEPQTCRARSDGRRSR